MRDVIRDVVSAMIPPSQEARAEATQQAGSQKANDHFEQTWPCMRQIELVQPPVALPVPKSLTVAAWNIERCKHVVDAAQLIAASGADIVLATEMDWGMARSGQKHTTQELAGLLGFGYLFGVEFVELGTGDPYETSLFKNVPNTHGLHGNAILSRYPISDCARLPVDVSGAWFVGQPKGDGQFRVGGRMAMAAQIGGVAFASVHFESESNASGRAAQMARLTQSMDALYGTTPSVIGGDLNTRGFADAGFSGAQILCRPESVEPTFAHLRDAGFDWRTVNTGLPTLRSAPGKEVRYPLTVLDWLFTRKIDGYLPRVVPAVSQMGTYVSDHELVLAQIQL